MSDEQIPAAEAAPAGEASEPTAELEAEPANDATPAAGERIHAILESLLFAADRPLGIAQLKALLGERDAAVVQAALDRLVAEYAIRGIRLQEIAGGWQFRTAPENATWVSRLLAARPVRLGRAQLETLAIVAYRQPITRPEIDEIRGVDCGAVLRTLLDRNLVRILGKKEEPGRPLLYGTTREFLEFFHLKDLRDLPTLREFHELSEESRARVEALEEAAATVPEGVGVARPAAADLPPIDPSAEAQLLADLAAAEHAAERAESALPRPPTVEPSGG
jgi:segregation and condensation protein B